MPEKRRRLPEHSHLSSRLLSPVLRIGKNVAKNSGKLPLYAGIVLGFLVPLAVFLFPYSHWFFALWLVALGVVGFSFFRMRNRSSGSNSEHRKDLIIILVLVTAFSAWYVPFLSEIPVQLNSDEMVTMEWAYDLADRGAALFYADTYFYQSNLNGMLYVLYTKIFGGITLENVRFVNASMGLAGIAVFYLSMRMLMPRFESVVSSVVFGASHVYVGFSRAAIITNLGVLLAVLVIFFFFRGWLRKEHFYLYLAGIAAGLGWYTHYGGRLIIFLPAVFFGLYVLKNRFRIEWMKLIKFGCILSLGFLIVVIPLLAGTARTAEDVFNEENNFAVGYLKSYTLLTPEGMQLQKELTGAKTNLGALAENVKANLLMFNKGRPDYFWFYTNPSGTLVDIASGIFLWVGLAIVILRSRTKEAPLFFAGSFLFLLLILSTVIIPSPYLARLIILLPFIAYFSSQGIFFFCGKVSKIFANNRAMLRTVLILAFLIAIVLINVKNYHDSVSFESERGHDHGGIYRDLISKKDVAGHTFILGADSPQSHHSEFYRRDSFYRKMAGANQTVIAIDFSKNLQLQTTGTATLYARYNDFRKFRDEISREKTITAVRNLTPGGAIVAVELR